MPRAESIPTPDETTAITQRVLENEHLRVVFLPEHGGKIISLISKRTGIEWVLPPLRPHAEARTDGGFEAWDGGGFDECLPTVAATATAPDHGEVWRNHWHEEPAGDAVVLRTTAIHGAVAFERRARLENRALVLDYSVSNESEESQSLLYSAHPLLRVEEGDRIILPPQVKQVRVEGSNGDRLGSRGASIAWPQMLGEDLSTVGPPDGQQADKLFAGPLARGWCALFRPAKSEGIEITFNAEVLPFVGLWICRAAWPDSGPVKQYTVALEPASAPCDSLADAEREGLAWTLKPGDRRSWSLRLRIVTGQDMQEGTSR